MVVKKYADVFILYILARPEILTIPVYRILCIGQDASEIERSCSIAEPLYMGQNILKIKPGLKSVSPG